MRAARFDGPLSLALVDVPRPELGPGEALIAVSAAGLCAGDLHIYTGKNPYATYPRIGCHEVAGRVVANGEGVSGPALGSRVVVDPFIGCGHCYPCRVRKRNCCANLRIVGVHRDGGFADYLAAPAANLVPIPDAVDDFHAAFAEPVAIGVQGCRRAEVGAEKVLVLGAGPIGLAIVEVARARGAEVFTTDLSPERLAIAESLGATPVPGGEGLLDRTLSITSGEGFPVVMEATGAVAAMESTPDLVAAGGRVVILGLVRQGIGVNWPGLDLTRKEMTILGSRASLDCFPEALSLLASGCIRYPEIATRLSLDAAPATFARLADDPMALHKAVFLTESA